MERLAPKLLSYEEFLTSPDVPERSEWVQGRVIPMPTVHLNHAEIHRFLLALFSGYADITGHGVVLSEPFNMRLTRSGRSPDVMVVLDRNRLRDHHVDGPADLVVEIVSPE